MQCSAVSHPCISLYHPSIHPSLGQLNQFAGRSVIGDDKTPKTLLAVVYKMYTKILEIKSRSTGHDLP